VSWQVVPRALIAMLHAADRHPPQRVFSAMMRMTRLEIAALERAYAGR